MATDETLIKLQKFKRSVLPKYYSAADGVSVSISSSTEDALILVPSTTKTKAVEYLKKIVDAEESQATKDYNKLLEEVASQQVAEGDAAVAELDQIIGKFKEFLQSITGRMDETGANIQAGLQPLLAAMTRRLGRIVEIDQTETFHRQFSDAAYEKFKQAATIDAKRELRSWIRVMMSYPT